MQNEHRKNRIMLNTFLRHKYIMRLLNPNSQLDPFCSICMFFMHNPCKLPACEHVFCQDCVKKC